MTLTLREDAFRLDPTTNTCLFEICDVPAEYDVQIRNSPTEYARAVARQIRGILDAERQAAWDFTAADNVDKECDH